jgi:hypothetical protein
MARISSALATSAFTAKPWRQPRVRVFTQWLGDIFEAATS